MNSNISYTYTLDGTRLAKQVGNTKTEYTLDGNLIVRQKTGNEILNFYYDSTGKLLEMGYKANASAAETYYFVTRNSQGDIMELYKSADSTKVGSYSYDSWGKLLGIQTTSDPQGILQKNPFRYRGYYYDAETQWYYLQSRYYDPEVKRFLSSDVTGLLTASSDEAGVNQNLYAYCDNNPVMRADDGGHVWHTIAGGIIGALIGAATQVVSNLATGKSLTDGLWGAATGGATYGAIMASTGNLAAASYASAAVQSATNEVVSYVKGDKALSLTNVAGSIKNVGKDTAVNGSVAAVTGNLAGEVVRINQGWIKPDKIVSSFTGNYAQKVWQQTSVQGVMQYVYNVVTGHWEYKWQEWKAT